MSPQLLPNAHSDGYLLPDQIVWAKDRDGNKVTLAKKLLYGTDETGAMRVVYEYKHDGWNSEVKR